MFSCRCGSASEKGSSYYWGVRRALQGGEAGLQAAEHCWAFMKQIRGTASYWNDAKSNLFAMIRSLGPPTWFLTLSADDFCWDDLAIYCTFIPEL